MHQRTYYARVPFDAITAKLANNIFCKLTADTTVISTRDSFSGRRVRQHSRDFPFFFSSLSLSRILTFNYYPNRSSRAFIFHFCVNSIFSLFFFFSSLFAVHIIYSKQLSLGAHREVYNCTQTEERPSQFQISYNL